jgi:succinyl-CoA synthetase beta subunit
MNLVEYDAKRLVLAPANIRLLDGALCHTVAEAAAAAERIGPCVVKAQVPTGKRGKAGGIRLAATPAEARDVAERILGMNIAGHPVASVMIEAQAAIIHEYYAAVLHAPRERCSLVLFSTEGGMDIEEIAESHPEMLRKHWVRTTDQFDEADAMVMLDGLALGTAHAEIARILVAMYRRYRETDAELIEINPLVQLADGNIAALDCKFVLDDGAAHRQSALAAAAAPDPSTPLERRANEVGLKFIELDGPVGILANGAGLTMTTMDVVSVLGGKPANFLEIGGDAYTKAEPALELLLAKPEIRALVVNFCGAFARTDVMARGVVEAWQRLEPDLPVFFSVHGTGSDEAVALVRDAFGIEPFDLMEDAVRAAIEAAQ